MRLRIAVLAAAPALAWAQPAFLAGPKVTNLSHSTARVTWVTDSQPTASEIEWGLTTAYGATRTALAYNAAPYTSSVLISGLTPNTTYHCRARLNGGAVLSGDVTFTTAAEPSPHPAPPVAPAALAVARPVITGNTYTIDVSCSNLASTLTAIAGLTGNANHEIVIPAGTTCTGTWNFPARPNHTGWIVVRSSAVDTAAFPPEGVRWTPNWSPGTTLARFVTPVLGATRGTQGNIPSSSCAASETGEGGFYYSSSGPTSTVFGLLRCSDSYPAYTGATLIDSFSGSSPVTVTVPGHTLVEGQVVDIPTNGYVAAGRYLVYGVAGNTFKINTPQIGSYSGGVSVTVRNQWRNPAHTKGSGPPSGSCTPEQWYYDTAAALHEAYWCVAGAWVKFTFVSPSDDSTHSAIEVLGDKYYFAGIEATNQQVPGYPDSFPAGWDTPALNSSDQGHINRLVYVNHAQDVVFDRCWIHAQPKPSRVHGGIRVEGDRFALVESYLDWFQEWRTGGYWQNGGSNNLTHYQGKQALIRNNYLECAGINYFAPNTSYGSPGSPPSDVTITRNTFKKRAEWRRTGAQPYQFPNRQSWELKHGQRYLLEGNVFDYQWSGINAAAFVLSTPRCSGLPGAQSLTGWSGNTITLASASATFEPGDVLYLTGTDAAHDGLWEVAGNGCPSNCALITLVGSPPGSGSGGSAWLRASGRTITDLDLRHNSFYQGTEVFRLAGTDNDCASFRLPQSKRVRFHNNLMVDLNIRRYADGGRVDLNGAFAAYGDYGARFLYVLNGDYEDIIATHNTLYGSRGNLPTMLVTDYASEGLTLSDNLHTFDHTSFNGIRATGTSGTATLNASFKRDDTPNWTAENNVMCCGWAGYSGSYPPTFRWPATAAEVGWLKAGLTAPYDFRLRHDSPYISGGAQRASDGLDVGVDMDLLEAAQGRVRNVRVHSLGSSSATLAYLAPDSAACTIEYGLSATWGTGTRVSDGGGDRARNVTLSGLNPHTLYHYRVLCAVEQPAGSFQTP